MELDAQTRAADDEGQRLQGRPCLQEVLSGVSVAETPRGASAGRQLAGGSRPGRQGVRA